ncbi:MAG TPA: putative glycoside hydrolase [Rectinemataceae bacterium]|nr:putative glycoside hydrolase [Rectinemataceae bacterium]
MKSRYKLISLSLILASGIAVAFAVTRSGPTPSSAAASVLPPLEAGAGLAEGEVLAGSREGLFRISMKDGSSTQLVQGAEIRKILRPAGGKAGWYFLGSRGIIHSDDLATFDERNKGLPFKTYKDIVDGAKQFRREVMDLKDLESDPSGSRLVTCTKDEVWYSEDMGLNWKDLGSPSFITGLKCVALAPFPGTNELAVWASHPIKGLFVRKLAAKSPWVSVSKGLYFMPTMQSADEVADLVWVPASPASLPEGAQPASASSKLVAPPSAGSLWASDSFQEKIYRSNLAAPAFTTAWDDGQDFGVAESLSPLPDGSLLFVHEGAVMRLPPSGAPGEDIEATNLVSQAQAAHKDSTILSLAWNEEGTTTALSELWLLQPDRQKDIRREAAGKNALYLQAGYIVNPVARAKNFGILADRGLNAFVIDLKDDNGRLRFAPTDPLVKSLAKVVNPIDIEGLAAEAKAKGVWLIARIPVFKDEVMARALGGKYAVWDGTHNQPWVGLKVAKTPDVAPPSGFNLQQPPIPGVPQPPPTPQPAGSAAAGDGDAAPGANPTPLLVPNGERWVDPYSEEVWAYNVALANEVIARGFDEVQFDYIRFPTDGVNLDDAQFRWKDPGMDKESAITSFLAFARERIKAPISIDIYGANGWYRSGARTGQDVETLARYVDVICPMFYPSHFEQGFLAEAPAVDRPYRIYRLGTLRNARIARDRVIVRPYVQAFYMGVSYDKVWYNPDYVAREVTGVIQGENLGMTFWNNVDRYDDIPYLSRSADGALVVRSASAEPGAPYEVKASASAAATAKSKTGATATTGSANAATAGGIQAAASTKPQDEAPAPVDSGILN